VSPATLPHEVSIREVGPRDVREVLGRPVGSHTLLAGPIDWHRAS
jgi:hypothetical protein